TIAKESAIFRQVGPMMGSFDAGFGTWYLEDLVGKKKAKEIWFRNPRLSAREALELGMINQIVPDDQLKQATRDIALEIAERGARGAGWLPSRVEAVAVMLGCLRQGYVCNPSLHRNYTVAEIVELLTRTRAAALFAQPGYGADAHRADIFAAVSELPNLRRVYTLGDGPANATPFPAPGSSRPLPPIDTNPDKVTY